MKQILPLLCAALLAACAASDDAAYPSLAPRPIEKIVAQDGASKSVSAGPAIEADPAIGRQIAAARKALDEARDEQARAIAAAVKPAPDAERGSEAWADNQTSISRLASAQAALRNVETDIGAIQSALVQARVGGAATEALEAEARTLQAEAETLLTRGEAEIGQRSR